MSILVRPEPADIQAIAELVWSSFLGEEPLLPRLGAAGVGEGVNWSAAVSISGGWEGTITVELTAGTAEFLTRAMLGLDGPLEDADVADAVGELANMIGGNIKGLMPGPSVLTLPVVASGQCAVPITVVEVSRMDAVWRGDPVQVTVYAVAS